MNKKIFYGIALVLIGMFLGWYGFVSWNINVLINGLDKSNQDHSVRLDKIEKVLRGETKATTK